MNSFIAATVLLFLFVALSVLLERNHRRTAGLPRAPFGTDAGRDADLGRIWHDLDVTRQSR